MSFTYIAGHLGADPEVRFTANGKKVTTIRVAVKGRKTQNAEDNTIWWKVTVWGEQFDNMIKYLKKGSAIMIVGDMHKPEIYTDRQGNPQVSLNMTAFHLMFPPFGRSDRATQENFSSVGSDKPASNVADQMYSGFTAGQGSANDSESFEMPSDDEIPF